MTTSKTNKPALKKFNTVIKVEVSVDSIAEQLLSFMKPEEKHKELVTETIIGTLLHENRVGILYNALNGYTNEINFKEGDKIICTEIVNDYLIDNTTKTYRKIGPCTVKEKNLY